MKQLFDVLTIDPGMHTGYAFWKGDLSPVTGALNLTKSKTTQTQEEQLSDMWSKFDALLKTMQPKRVIIEGVRVYAGSTVSMISASTGDLMKLCYLVGGYCSLCQRHQIEFRTVEPATWKGQLTKEATKAQVKLITGSIYHSEHICDAVGIGLSAMKLLPIGRSA